MKMILAFSGSGETFFGDVRRPYSYSESFDSSSLYEVLPPKGRGNPKVGKRQAFKTPQKAHPSPEKFKYYLKLYSFP